MDNVWNLKNPYFEVKILIKIGSGNKMVYVCEKSIKDVRTYEQRFNLRAMIQRIGIKQKR